MLLVLVAGVSAFNYYENYTLNESMIIAFDDFNRTSSEVGNFTYPTNDSWVETSDQTIQDTPTFFTDGEQLVINKTQAHGNYNFLIFWDGTQLKKTIKEVRK